MQHLVGDLSEEHVGLPADRAGGAGHPVSAAVESRHPQRGAQTPRGLGGGSTTAQKVSETKTGGSSETQKVKLKQWEADPQEHKK